MKAMITAKIRKFASTDDWVSIAARSSRLNQTTSPEPSRMAGVIPSSRSSALAV